MASFPGGPSPDSALPSHSKLIYTGHQAAAFAIDTETHHPHRQGGDEMASQQRQQELAPSGPPPITRELASDLPPQPSEHLATSADTLPRHPFSDEHTEIAPDVRVADPNTEATAERSPSLGREARLSTSVASRPTDRSLPANDVGEGASAAGAVTSANEPPDVDPNLQARAAGVQEEIRQKATIGKKERKFSFLLFRLFRSTKLLTLPPDAHRRRRPKAVENRKARGQGRENHSAHRATRISGDTESARGFHQGKPFLSAQFRIPSPFFSVIDHDILGRGYVLLVALSRVERRAQSRNGPARCAHGK